MKIENFNNYKKCNELYCDSNYTHAYPITMAGLKMYIVLCEKHYNLIVEANNGSN
jgi:hypothetical protein